MTPRLSSEVLVSAMIRRVQAEGGNATVLAKGDASAGAIILACAEKGRISGLYERALGLAGDYRWVACGPEDTENNDKISEYLARRRARDPDIWVLELDIPDAERFAAETIAPG